jgi:hypothetical protein
MNELATPSKVLDAAAETDLPSQVVGLDSNIFFGWAGLILNVVGITIAIAALIAAVRQLKPLRRTLEDISTEQRRARRIRTTLKPPRKEVRVRGFDARFDGADWNRILAPLLGKKTSIRMDLSRQYRDFYDWYRQQKERDSSEVLILDLLVVPEFLKAGLIKPLNTLLPIQDLMSKRAEAYGTRHSDSLRKLVEYLCSDVNGAVGALPLWVNSHGRFIPDHAYLRDEGPSAAESDFERMLASHCADTLLAKAGIQTSYLTFELWAHLAYRGAQIFRAKSHPSRSDDPPGAPRGGLLGCDLVTEPEAFLGFCEAVADLATRLRYSTITRDQFEAATRPADFVQQHAFRLGHINEARMIRNGVAGWKPCCSSELLRKAMPRRDEEVAAQLSDESWFKPPYINRLKKHNQYTYMSAVGGYGLALPASSSSNSDALLALEFLFLANPCLNHPYVVDMADDSLMEVEEFAERHVRPRVPFWGEIEDELNQLIFSLMLKLDRRQDDSIAPWQFWETAVEMFKNNKSCRRQMQDFVDVVSTIVLENGWEFEAVSPPRRRKPPASSTSNSPPSRPDPAT